MRTRKNRKRKRDKSKILKNQSKRIEWILPLASSLPHHISFHFRGASSMCYKHTIKFVLFIVLYIQSTHKNIYMMDVNLCGLAWIMIITHIY